jgi:hypothetical protein
MQFFKKLFLVILLMSAPAFATPASDESIKELLTVTDAKKVIGTMSAQIETVMNVAIQQSMQGKSPTPKQQEAIQNFKNNMIAIIQDEISWEKMESMYLRLYKETFTDEEVAGMLIFYKSPAGQAVTQKMPALVQKAMQQSQVTSVEMKPKIQKAVQQFALELIAAGK